jgi:hypothetical protein
VIDERYGTGNADFDAAFAAGFEAGLSVGAFWEKELLRSDMRASVSSLLSELALLLKAFEKGRDRPTYVEVLEKLVFSLIPFVGVDTAFALSLLAATLEDLDRGATGELVRPAPQANRQAYSSIKAWAQACIVLALECMILVVKENKAAADRLSKHLGRRVGLKATTLLTWRNRFRQGRVESKFAQSSFDAAIARLDAGQGEWSNPSAGIEKFISEARWAVPDLADLPPKYRERPSKLRPS